MRKRPPPHNMKRVRSFGTNFRYEFLSKHCSVVQSKSFMAHIPALLCERDKEVVRYTSLPIVISYKTPDGVEKSHIPDLQVHKIDGTIEIHDVTLSKRRKKEAIRHREAAVLRYCEARGWRYFVDTEETLPGPTETANLYMLYGFAAQAYCNQKVREILLSDLEIGTNWRICVLTKQASENLGISRGEIMATVFWMIWFKELETDMSVLLVIAGQPNRKAIVWRSK